MMIKLRPSASIDAIVLGRANVDMYASQVDESLMNSRTFEKSVGGSAANIAVGMARLGRRIEFLGMVSDDQFGQYVERFLQENGIGTQYLYRDTGGSRTSLAFAERRKVDSHVLFYRNQASDLMIDIEHIPVEAFARAVLLIVTGTGLSASPSREATLYAMEYAEAQGIKVVLDLDWRASAWKTAELAGLFYRLAAAKAHIIIGTHEEYKVLLNSRNAGRDMADQDIATQLLSGQTELVVVKNGDRGSTSFARDGISWRVGIFPVEVQKNYGAGDAFAAAMLHGLLEGQTVMESMRWGAGAAALVVGSTACAAAAPNEKELLQFIRSFKDT